MDKSRQVVTIKQQVYQILRDDICNGVYAPGQQIYEIELSKNLSVSRSPIREALRQLATEGLVVEHPNRGTYVKDYSPKDIDDIYELRTLLESYAITNSSKYLTPEIRQELLSYSADFKTCYNNNDLQCYIRIDAQLHNTIITLSGNSLLISTYDRIAAMVSQFRRFSLQSKRRFDDSVTEHTQIIQNILEGNGEEAARINREHLLLAKDSILNNFDQLPQKSIPSA